MDVAYDYNLGARPKINLSFQGWIQDIEITHVTVVATGETLDVSDRDSQSVVDGLNRGEWAVSLAGVLGEGSRQEV